MNKQKTHVFFLSEMIKDDIFNLADIIFFENRLYERFIDEKNKVNYRVILNSDDYDYVTDRNLKRRLNTAFIDATLNT
jgi:hypothetical protein